MKFNEFLNGFIPYRKTNYSKKEDFFKEIFLKSNCNFHYSDEYAKKICNGTKPLTREFKDIYATIEIEKIKSFLLDNLNQIRCNEIYRYYLIPEDEKKDYDCIIETIAITFKNFINSKQISEESIVLTYEQLIDIKYKSNDPDANIKALTSSKQKFLNALNSISKICKKDDLISLQQPLIDFYNNIISVYRILNENCNRIGKYLIKIQYMPELRKKCNLIDFLLSDNTDSYQINKTIKITIYDHILNGTKSMEYIYKLYDDDSNYKLINNITKNFPFRETFFSEEIHFTINDNTNNILDDFHTIANITAVFLNELESNFGTNVELNRINTRIIEKNIFVSNLNIIFITDGHLDNVTKKLFLTSPIHANLITENGKIINMSNGDYYEPLIKLYKTTSLLDAFKKFTTHQVYLYNESKGKNLMTDIQIIDSKNHVTLFLFALESKATMYRICEKIISTIKEQKIKGFFMQAIIVNNNSNNIYLPIEIRNEIGEEQLCCYAYIEGKLYTQSMFKQDVINGKVKIYNDAPLLAQVKLFMNEIDKN